MVGSLIGRGVNFDVTRERDGFTPLYEAIERGRKRVLLHHDFSPDVHAVDNLGNTPLHIALQTRGVHMIVIAALLEAGANVHSTNEDGNTSLHMVEDFPTYGGTSFEKVARCLLQAGADLEARNHLGQTVLLQGLQRMT